MAHPQSGTRAMAPHEAKHIHGNSPRNTTSPIVEELQRAGEVTRSSPHSSPTLWKDHDLEYDQSPSHKKSVITKVKEKAKKWRNTLSKKKHNDDGNTTPSLGLSLDDVDEEDPEFLGAPMYESEMAPEEYKETARQHPRAFPVISEKHVLPSSVTCEDKSVTETVSGKRENEKSPSPKTLTETVAEKLAPAYNMVSDATHTIASKIQSLAISTPEAPAAAGLDPMEEGRAASSEAGPTKVAQPTVFHSAKNSSSNIPISTDAPAGCPDLLGLNLQYNFCHVH